MSPNVAFGLVAVALKVSSPQAGQGLPAALRGAVSNAASLLSRAATFSGSSLSAFHFGHALSAANISESTAMSSPDLGVSLSANGLSVALNPNGIEMRVTRGPKGAVLIVASCGVTLRCALPEEARQHLVQLLSNPPSGASPASPANAGRGAVAGADARG